MKVVTGSKALFTVNGQPLIYTADVAWEQKRCSCVGNQYPELFPSVDTAAQYKLFTLLHKLLHGDKYAA